MAYAYSTSPFSYIASPYSTSSPGLLHALDEMKLATITSKGNNRISLICIENSVSKNLCFYTSLQANLVQCIILKMSDSDFFLLSHETSVFTQCHLENEIADDI